MNPNTGKIALVTGGSRGIGAAICKALGRDGFKVIINYSSNEAKAAEVKQEIVAAGGSAELAQFNVADSAQVNEKFEWVTKTHGPVHTLVNNAGIAIDGLLIRMKDEDLEKTLDVDLKGAIYCTRAAVKQMMRAREGSIIQISSVIGEMGNAGQAAYSAAKAGLIGFTKSVAKEWGGRGIRANVVTPGFIETEMTAGLSAEHVEAIKSRIPLESFGQPDDVAHLVAFLASPKSRYITGQVVGINGGMYI